MTAAAILRLVAALWRPLAAILGALALYRKGRADEVTRRDLKDAKAATETFERAADAPVHTDPDLARRRMRDRDPDQR